MDMLDCVQIAPTLATPAALVGDAPLFASHKSRLYNTIMLVDLKFYRKYK